MINVIGFEFKGLAPKRKSNNSSKSSTTKTSKPKSNKPKRVKTITILRDVEGEIVKDASSLRAGSECPCLNVLVDVDSNLYPLHTDSYSCVGKRLVFRYVYDTWYTMIRCKEETLGEMVKCYYPVKPGKRVKGSVINQNGIISFKIKKIL